MEEKRFLTTREYAEEFSMNEQSVRNALARGTLNGFKVSAGAWRIPNPAYGAERSELEARVDAAERRVEELERRLGLLAASLA